MEWVRRRVGWRSVPLILEVLYCQCWYSCGCLGIPGMPFPPSHAARLAEASLQYSNTLNIHIMCLNCTLCHIAPSLHIYTKGILFYLYFLQVLSYSFINSCFCLSSTGLQGFGVYPGNNRHKAGITQYRVPNHRCHCLSEATQFVFVFNDAQ